MRSSKANGRGQPRLSALGANNTDPSLWGFSTESLSYGLVTRETRMSTKFATSPEQCRAACSVCQSATCHDDADGCARWAESGECHANADYMLKACPFSCRVCGINFKSQCRRDGDMRPMAVPGTIDATFERAAREYAKPYGTACDEDAITACCDAMTER